MIKRTTAIAFAAAMTLSATAVPAMADSLTVYSAGPRSLITNLARGFEQQTGISVDVYQAGSGAVLSRLEAERSNPQADVVISASWSWGPAFQERGDLLAYTSPNAAMVPESMKSDYYVAQGATVLAIMWNTNSGTPRPRDWSDLAAVEFKDLVTMPDPARSGSAYALLSGLAASPAMGWDMIESLAENGIIAPGLNAPAMNPVFQGAKAAVFGAADYLAYKAQQEGETVEVIFPESGTVMEPRPVMILNTTRNEEAAKRFVDYILSDEGQAMVAQEYLLPARSDIPALRPGLDEITIIESLPDETLEARERNLARFRTLLGM